MGQRLFKLTVWYSKIKQEELAARGESTIGCAHRSCGQDQGARRRRCGNIVDDEQRRDCPQYLCAQRVLAAQGHLLRWRSSTMSPHRLRRAALHLPLRRPERGLLYFHHGLLGPRMRNLAPLMIMPAILAPGSGDCGRGPHSDIEWYRQSSRCNAHRGLLSPDP